MRKLLSYIFLAIIIAGFTGFIYGSTYFRNGPNSSQRVSFDRVQGIILDNNNIFIGLASYNCIQQYDTLGNFIQSWNTNTFSKNFTFKLFMGAPKVRTTLPNLRQLNDLNSNVLNDTIKNILGFNQIENPLKSNIANNTYYSIEGIFNKELIKNRNGKKEVIYKQSFFENFLSGYTTPWIFGAVSIFCLMFLNVFLIIKHFENGAAGVNWKLFLKDVFIN